MNIEVKLKNLPYCDGCPCLLVSQIDQKALCLFSQLHIMRELECGVISHIRPTKCIEENGE